MRDSPSAARLHLTLLGGFDARLATGDRLELRTRKAGLLWCGWRDEPARANVRHTLSEVARVYAGDLLAGLVVKEGAFEDWLRGERDRLRALALDALERSVDGCARAGRPGDAARLLPFDEILEREIGAAPDPATTGLYEELRV